jgi:hypothetical protein
MKNIALLFGLIFLALGCSRSAVEKPSNLIDEDKMVEIIYDLSLLEAIKSQKPIVLENTNVNPNTYIYKKYKIDSVQFAKSNAYYASDIKTYKEIYEKVSKRLEDKKAGGQPITNPDEPQVR